MMEEEAFEALAREIQSQGYELLTAIGYASLIGDHPTYDAEGMIVVMKGAEVVAKLKPLKFFTEG